MGSQTKVKCEAGIVLAVDEFGCLLGINEMFISAIMNFALNLELDRQVSDARDPVSMLRALIDVLSIETLGIIPTGTTASAYQGLANETGLIFYDRKPREQVRDSKSIGKEDADYFYISSLSHRYEIYNSLIECGIPECRILDQQNLGDHLIFAFLDDMHKSMISNSIRKQGQGILVVENLGSLAAKSFLETAMEESFVAVADLQDVEVNRDSEESFNLKLIDAVDLADIAFAVVLTSPARYSEVMRRSKQYGVGFDMLYPFATNEEIKRNDKSHTPAAVFGFPHAGWGRFAPVFNSLAVKLDRKQIPWRGLQENSKYANNKRDASIEELKKDSENCLDAQLDGLDYYEYSITHEIYDIRQQKDYSRKTVKLVQLIRDPRDIINSVVLRSKVDDYEKRCDEVIMGFFYSRSRRQLIYWPDAKTICEIFLYAVKEKNVCVVRFEDLHDDSINTYCDLLAWLGWDHPEHQSLDLEDYEESMHLGTFEFQTNGKLARGGEGGKSIASCRKGIVGDWKNNWTEQNKSLFKNYCGSMLVDLGYEQDMQW